MPMPAERVLMEENPEQPAATPALVADGQTVAEGRKVAEKPVGPARPDQEAKLARASIP
jgi:hypothetical protein